MDYQRVEDWRQCPELKRLNDLSDPPKHLFYTGKWQPEIFEDCVAIVGSRRMTEYGKRVMEKMIPPMVMAGKTIISGFMYGVDQYAHQLALENGGKTVAVLGWGIAQKLEEREKLLAAKIVDKGSMIISEWERQPAMLWTFPVRNRIVAALSKDIYVIEGGIKSGSLITADWANKLNRPLWAVPGPITSRVSEGTNWLIDSRRASMWTGPTASRCTPGLRGVKGKDKALVEILENEALSADEVARKLQRPVAAIGAQLSLLELTGQLKARGGKYYVE